MAQDPRPLASVGDGLMPDAGPSAGSCSPLSCVLRAEIRLLNGVSPQAPRNCIFLPPGDLVNLKKRIVKNVLPCPAH